MIRLLLAAVVFFQAYALRAEESSCALVQKLAEKLGCMGATAMTGNSEESISNSFGGDVCGTAQVLADDRNKQKAECDAWLKEKKGELAANYITGNCTTNCSPCSGGQQCRTSGEVRYRGK